MRILIYGLNFAPELIGVGKFTGEMAEWLAVRGHQVRVVTAPPFNPSSRVFPGYSAWSYRREDRFFPSTENAGGDHLPHGVTQGNGSLASSPNPGGVLLLQATLGAATKPGELCVFRCPLWVPQQPSTSKRALHLASFAASSFWSMLRHSSWRPEVVLVIEPTLLCLPAAVLAARMAGAQSWLHVQDFEVDAAFDLGMLTSPLLKRLATRVEQLWMGAFDRVSTISEKMCIRLADKSVESRRCVLFPNWVDTESIFPMAGPSLLRAELGIPEDAVVALYSGAMARKQGLELLAETGARLAHLGQLHFLFCGDGPGKSGLSAATAGLNKVHWLPLQPIERLNELLNAADIHLLPQRAEAADLVMPSKLTGMLASGRPVVCSAAQGTQLAEVVETRGMVVPPGDAHSFTWAVEQLASHPGLRDRLGRNARAYAVSQLDKKAVLERFEQDLLGLVAGNPGGRKSLN